MIKTITYPLTDIIPYINWIYFFHAWGFEPRFAAIANIHGCDACRAGWLASFNKTDIPKAAEAMQLFKDANRMLTMLATDFTAHARFGLFEANSDGDDLLLYPDADDKPYDSNLQSTFRLPLLRQQHPNKEGHCLCIADFVRPAQNSHRDKAGVFAATVDPEIEHMYEEGAYADNFKHLLCQTLADRLAEAATERMHEQVRKTFWGYASDEQLTTAELFQEKFKGIRPAVGYPSLPDQSINFLLDRLIDFGTIGIRLTENGAMSPHASVSGLMIAHPAARYFSIGKIGHDQLQDYARRRGLPEEAMKKFLIANL